MINIHRWHQPDCTLGRLICGKLQCFSLELPDFGNRPDISCIPAGTYRAFKRHSPKNGLCIELKDVPGRAFIQIHAGNYTRDIAGCILVGRAITFLDGDKIPDVANSRDTLNELLGMLPDEFDITIH